MLGVFPFVMMFLVTSIAMLRERTSGTMERLLTTPINKADLLFGYGLAYSLVAAAQAVVTTIVAFQVLGLSTEGSVALVIVMAVADAILGVALGLLSSAFARTEFQVMQMMPVVILPQFFVCGLFVPRDQMAGWLEGLSAVFPLTYAVDAMLEIGGAIGGIGDARARHRYRPRSRRGGAGAGGPDPAAPQRMSTGRRKGNADTRQTILIAARELFAANGFDGTSIRAIAGRAGVDVALVGYYFGNKQQLFTEVVSPPIDLAATVGRVVALPLADWPQALIEIMLDVMDSPLSSVMIANFRGVIREQSASEMMGRFMLENVAQRVTTALPESVSGDRAWRANLLASQMVGLLVGRYILRLEPLASATRAEVLGAYVPTIRRYLMGPLDDMDGSSRELGSRD